MVGLLTLMQIPTNKLVNAVHVSFNNCQTQLRLCVSKTQLIVHMNYKQNS